MKRIISIILVLVMLFSVSCFAEKNYILNYKDCNYKNSKLNPKEYKNVYNDINSTQEKWLYKNPENKLELLINVTNIEKENISELKTTVTAKSYPRYWFYGIGTSSENKYLSIFYVAANEKTGKGYKFSNVIDYFMITSLIISSEIGNICIIDGTNNENYFCSTTERISELFVMNVLNSIMSGNPISTSSDLYDKYYAY